MDVVASAIATTAVSVAALVDLRYRRIPNALTAGLILVGIALNFGRFGTLGIGLAVGGAALGLVLLLPLYVIRAMSAGDVKLLAGLGAVLGPHVLISVAVYGALVGGLISAVMLAR